MPDIFAQLSIHVDGGLGLVTPENLHAALLAQHFSCPSLRAIKIAARSVTGPGVLRLSRGQVERVLPLATALQRDMDNWEWDFRIICARGDVHGRVPLIDAKIFAASVQGDRFSEGEWSSFVKARPQASCPVACEELEVFLSRLSLSLLSSASPTPLSPLSPSLARASDKLAAVSEERAREVREAARAHYAHTRKQADAEEARGSAEGLLAIWAEGQKREGAVAWQQAILRRIYKDWSLDAAADRVRMQAHALLSVQARQLLAGGMAADVLEREMQRLADLAEPLDATAISPARMAAGADLELLRMRQVETKEPAAIEQDIAVALDVAAAALSGDMRDPLSLQARTNAVRANPDHSSDTVCSLIESVIDARAGRGVARLEALMARLQASPDAIAALPPPLLDAAAELGQLILTCRAAVDTLPTPTAPPERVQAVLALVKKLRNEHVAATGEDLPPRVAVSAEVLEQSFNEACSMIVAAAEGVLAEHAAALGLEGEGEGDDLNASVVSVASGDVSVDQLHVASLTDGIQALQDAQAATRAMQARHLEERRDGARPVSRQNMDLAAQSQQLLLQASLASDRHRQGLSRQQAALRAQLRQRVLARHDSKDDAAQAEAILVDFQRQSSSMLTAHAQHQAEQAGRAKDRAKARKRDQPKQPLLA